MKALLLMPLLTMAMWAADITGRWTGTVVVDDPAGGNKISTPVKADFAQKDGGISGKIGRREDEVNETIRNGRLEGNKLQFEVTSAETSGAIKFNLVIEGNRITGDMKGTVDSGPIVGKVVLTKQ